MRVIKLSLTTGECEVLLGESIANLKNYCNAEKLAIITDRNVRSIYGHLFPAAEVIEIGLGEESKTLETVNMIYERFLQSGLDRSSTVVGIGGGIISDIAGFAASTYLRGLCFGFVPTTLLAQVDACVGGKNGVNFKGYKNLIGVFRQPQFCILDFGLLKTLPERELRCGMAEVVKHALIGDPTLFSYLEENSASALSLHRTVIEKIVHDSLVVKIKIVSADETEKGERRKLNFGHTFGHAVERTLGIPHGEAVSIGMVVAARLSVSMGMLAKKDGERIEALLEKIGLPTAIKGDKEAIFDAIEKDKKRENENINFVLLEGIGKAKVAEISIRELEGIVNDLC